MEEKHEGIYWGYIRIGMISLGLTDEGSGGLGVVGNKGIYWGYTGGMEKKMATTTLY